MKRKCDVCGKEAELFVRCSATGAISFGYCEKCLTTGREPYYAIIASLMYCISNKPTMNDIAEWYHPIIRVSLEAEGKTEEELFKDIKAFEEDYEKEVVN